jgi:hypothetical protein
MGVTRSTIVDGPGSLTYGTQQLFAKDTITAEVQIETWRPEISTHGQGAPRLRDAVGQVSFTPAGRLTTGILAILWPAALRTVVPGTRLFGATDTALQVHSVAGKKITFASAAIIQMPELILSPVETAIGQAQFQCVIKNGGDRATAASFYAAADAAWSGNLLDADIITVPYTGVWNVTGSPLTIHTAEGWRVTFDVQTQPRMVDGIGTIDYLVEAVTVRASCRPVGLTASDIIGHLRPEGLAIGATLRQGRDLTITGGTGGLVVTLKDAVMVSGPCQWGKTELRAGEVGFEASADATGATFGAIFSLAIAGA